ncbi:MAG: bifunctional diaminohydroxyphosphoribosylaminopyrimidine deaminase/5-amino-6-(5-phosphoribosylamino)uracil reductase RibD, partial [Proteobacteria bacterium]|nr:bifunctional diaminohydroxyphosphoribosylaminopyrimidine deaminase/5-amino-6-(5-phosphoribosylamino)uracil reductase RibD [Pseudomonadota bacterium]
APNPSVGAVIVDEATGEVISRGWTQPGGRPHAEKEALRRAGDRTRGKTMFVTLEPCAHTGRKPTCSDALVTSGLKRVVCAIPDPNPIVSGRGFAQLRAAGIEVDVGLGADEARWLTLGHILRQTAERPFVQLKMALDGAGRVAPGDGAPVWVTGTEARAFAHLLRARADAILVGAGTVLADDPELTCRLPGLAHRSPDRIVLDTRLRTPPTAKVYRHQGRIRPRVWVAAALDVAEAGASHGEAMVLDAGSLDGGSLDLEGLLATLAGNGVTRLMVEGGPTVWHAFLSAGLVDEVCLVMAGHAAEGATIPVVTGDPAAYFAHYNLIPTPSRSRPLGSDRLLVFRRESP